jgi:hypothetical protein
MATSSSAQPEPAGLITADALYTLGEIQQRLKLGQHAMRQARRAGLPVRRIGRRAYVLGRDVIAFLDSVEGGRKS